MAERELAGDQPLGARGFEGASLGLLHSTPAGGTLPIVVKEMVLFELTVVLVSFSKDWELKHVTLCESLTRLPLCDHRHSTDQIEYLGNGWWVGAGGWLSAIPGSLSLLLLHHILSVPNSNQ